MSSVARELRAARETLHLTREQLAEKIGYTASYIEKIEAGKLPATEAYVGAAAPALAGGIDATALFGRLREDERREVIPDWFRPWRHHEQEATEIRDYEPLVVPGLLQTEAYAVALLGDPERVAARLERQAVLERAAVSVVIEEGVLRRKIGDAEVMAAQLAALTGSRAAVHVLPSDAGTCLGLDGGFALATVDGAELGYVDTPARGFVVPDAGVVWRMRQRWEALLAEALPRNLSQTMIAKAAETWSGS